MFLFVDLYSYCKRPCHEDPPPGADEELSELEFDQEMECCDEENIEGYSEMHEEEGEGFVKVSNSATQTEACRGCKSH